MSPAARPSAPLLRRVWLTLAVLALALKVMVPPGFMMAPRNETGFPLVICTAQGGSVVVQPGEPIAPHDQDSGKAAHDSPCLFAGHGVAATPPALAAFTPAPLVAYVEVRPRPLIGLQPGRSLTGPPLPARGPPQVLI